MASMKGMVSLVRGAGPARRDDHPRQRAGCDNGRAPAPPHGARLRPVHQGRSRFETPADNGLSHFVEHMLFRGTERYATSLALNRPSSARLDPHAETGRDYSLFQMALEPENVPAAIALLGELLGQPRFSDIELERQLILEEINEDYDEQGAESTRTTSRAASRSKITRWASGSSGRVQRREVRGGRRPPPLHRGSTARQRAPVHRRSDRARALVEAPRGRWRRCRPDPRRGPTAPRWPRAPCSPRPDAGSQTSLASCSARSPSSTPGTSHSRAAARARRRHVDAPALHARRSEGPRPYSIHAAIEPLADHGAVRDQSATANAKVAVAGQGAARAARRPPRRPGHGRRLAKARVRYRRDARIDRRRLAWSAGRRHRLYYRRRRCHSGSRRCRRSRSTTSVLSPASCCPRTTWSSPGRDPVARAVARLRQTITDWR